MFEHNEDRQNAIRIQLKRHGELFKMAPET